MKLKPWHLAAAALLIAWALEGARAREPERLPSHSDVRAVLDEARALTKEAANG